MKPCTGWEVIHDVCWRMWCRLVSSRKFLCFPWWTNIFSLLFKLLHVNNCSKFVFEWYGIAGKFLRGANFCNFHGLPFIKPRKYYGQRNLWCHHMQLVLATRACMLIWCQPRHNDREAGARTTSPWYLYKLYREQSKLCAKFNSLALEIHEGHTWFRWTAVFHQNFFWW